MILAAGTGAPVERPRDVGDDGQRLMLELSPGDPDDEVAGLLECQVLAVVTLERAPVAMEAIAVHLHDHALLGPEEVDLVAGDLDVRFRLGKASVAEQPAHDPFRPRAGDGRFLFLPKERSHLQRAGSPARTLHRGFG